MSCCWPKSSSNTTLVGEAHVGVPERPLLVGGRRARDVEADAHAGAMGIVGLGVHLPQLGVSAHRQVDRDAREEDVDDRRIGAQLPLALRPLEQLRHLLAHHHAAAVWAEVLAHERRREHVRGERVAVQREHVVALEEGVVDQLPVGVEHAGPLREEVPGLEVEVGQLGAEPGQLGLRRRSAEALRLQTAAKISPNRSATGRLGPARTRSDRAPRMRPAPAAGRAARR